MNFELKDIKNSKQLVVQHNKMHKYLMRPQDNEVESLEDDWLDCKTASAARLAQMRKSVITTLQQEVRFEQNQASETDESQQANETLFSSPTGTQDLQENENEVNDFKYSDCQLIAKSKAGLGVHKKP
ncbi:hypothetical protein BpHYR1_044628 [Brachionus plicatilis]|uniref:Uncharacterized protein n=1 Tax=Brachionus plicatilis TaxID=10195 RepID=A0A3M7RWC2_BRAPC|nr:hypothetical protein BpHYR1_044628 [Brachionus plicatilis]